LAIGRQGRRVEPRRGGVIVTLFGERYAPTLVDWLVSVFLVALVIFTLAGLAHRSSL
jgi:hypothetical protein